LFIPPRPIVGTSQGGSNQTSSSGARGGRGGSRGGSSGARGGRGGSRGGATRGRGARGRLNFTPTQQSTT